jgi:EAL domain-containing protein (putative c-di-GMP-specific phosphodiesterase class I)
MVPHNVPNAACNRSSTSATVGPHRADTAVDVWYLTELSKEFGAARNIAIHSSPFTIGRRHDQHLFLATATVSAQHAQLEMVEQRLAVTDLGSTNGTYVNGCRIRGATELKDDDLVQFAEFAFRVNRRTAELETPTQSRDQFRQALSLVKFDKLMNDSAVTPYYQPIVEIRTSQVVGHEVLARSRITGLEMPLAMFQAAAQLDLSVELSRMLRWEGIRYFISLADALPLFVNTHPSEISKPGLIESLEEIRKVKPRQPLVLEVHEASATNSSAMRELRAALRDLGIRLAYDDFGAGENRLMELTEAPPDFLKFDMTLVRDLDVSENRRLLLASLLKATKDLNVTSVAEGIETAAEAEACQEVGFDLAQGFHYGRPAPAAHFA